jgi:enoyl-CoA hydratase/carnithine racemase
MHTITLSGRGPNTMSLAMLEAVDRALDEAGDAPLIVTGAGTAFSAGLDLDALATLDASGVRDLLVAMERVTLRLFLHPAPTVALINGHAIAGGCLVAQCCDVRIAPRDSKLRIGMTGVAIGLTYPPFVLDVLGARLTAPNVERVLLSAAKFDVGEALGLGLIDAMVDPADAQRTAERLLAERVALPAASYAATKLALRKPRVDASVEARARFVEDVIPRWTAALLRR